MAPAPAALPGPFYRRATTAGGVLHFETGPVNIADPGPSDWNGYPRWRRRATRCNWSGRRVARRAQGASPPAPFWAVTDTGARSEGRDIGPAIAFDTKGGLHLVTPSGVYAFSGDGGQTWKREAVPLPAGVGIKTISLAVDNGGTVHIAFSAPVTRQNSAGGTPSGYWQLRTIDRGPDGTWRNPTDVLAHAPGWAEPKGGGDMLADWARIAADAKGWTAPDLARHRLFPQIRARHLVLCLEKPRRRLAGGRWRCNAPIRRAASNSPTRRRSRWMATVR